MRRSSLEQSFFYQLKAANLPQWQEEYRFHKTRKWRFDFAWPEQKIAVEVDGIVRRGTGGHQSEQGTTRDHEKQNEAILQGWRVMRVTKTMIDSGMAIEHIKRALL